MILYLLYVYTNILLCEYWRLYFFSGISRVQEGDEQIQGFFDAMPDGVYSASCGNGRDFPLGFILDFIEITFVVVPIVGPVLLAMGWIQYGWVVIAINLNLF